MLPVLNLGLPFCKILILHTLRTPKVRYSLFASHIPEGPCSCLCFDILSDNHAVSPTDQKLAQPSRFKFKYFYLLDILKFPITFPDWKCLPSPFSLHGIQVHIHLPWASCVSSCVLTTRCIKASKTQFSNNEEDTLFIKNLIENSYSSHVTFSMFLFHYK